MVQRSTVCYLQNTRFPVLHREMVLCSVRDGIIIQGFWTM